MNLELSDTIRDPNSKKHNNDLSYDAPFKDFLITDCDANGHLQIGVRSQCKGANQISINRAGVGEKIISVCFQLEILGDTKESSLTRIHYNCPNIKTDSCPMMDECKKKMYNLLTSILLKN